MSSKRVVAFVVAVLAVVALASVYAATSFPLTTTAAVEAAQPAAPQLPPRDPRPATTSQPSGKEAALSAAIAAQPGVPGPYIELSGLQEDRGAYAEAEGTLLAARSAVPNNTVVLRALSNYYNRHGDFAKTMEALEAVADIDPTDPARHQMIATYYWEKAYRDQRISVGDKQAYIEKGIAATDRALALDSQYVDALLYKNLLLRLEAGDATDPVRRAQLIAQADELRRQAMEIKKTTMPPPPPPPPPAPPRGYKGSEDVAAGDAPVRVGGNIKVPTKTKDVKPVYPEVALQARVAGVVIVEVLIGPSGQVQDARVLRSIPLLDAAALEAVRQWEFEPTVLNGRAVPVIMTVTVNFRPE
jgi:TonB family protein